MSGLIVHEWIERHGGSEKVLDAMVEAFPDANIHCLWNDAPHRYEDRTVTESWLSKTPLRRSKALALPFMPKTWSRTKVDEYDFLLVSSHLFAHHIGGRMPAHGPRKFVYVHSPARYLWTPELDSRGNHIGARVLAPLLKRVDTSRAAQGAEFAANSEYVKARIKKVWHQEARVIYPPVDVQLIQSESNWRLKLDSADEFRISQLPRQYILAASRFIPYKRLDIAIRAGEAAGIPVVLAGSGPQRQELAEIASQATVPVHIVDKPSDKLLYALYQEALVFVFAATEDFGIMPVEAMAAGTPTMVFREGGARESVEAVAGGVVLDSFSTASLKAGIEAALSINMDKAKMAIVEQFGEKVFAERIRNWISDVETPKISLIDKGTSCSQILK